MSSSLQRAVLTGDVGELAGSDSMSESGTSAGGGGGSGGGGGGRDDGEFLQQAADALGLSASDVFVDRVRVDRRQMEALIVGEDESQESAQIFFDRVEEQTRTRILWPSHLKIGSRSRKSPHVQIAGLFEDVMEAKKVIVAVLDSPDNRVTMKIDVSYLYHSHIIGRGGLVIKQVMEETGTHIHFPDSNRTSTTDKSSQVSLSGKLAGVEQARKRVRDLMPLVFLFDAPAPGAPGALGALGALGAAPDAVSPHVLQLQQQFHVLVRVRQRHRLNGVQVQVKGSELEVTRVTEATLCLIRHFCASDSTAEQVSVYTTLEIPPHHQPLVLGANCSNIKMIMSQTGTKIMVPDLNDPNIPQLKKNVITVLGPIRNVYLARQKLLGSLPVLLLFEISDYTTLDCSSLPDVMFDLDVQISFRHKEKQKTVAVSIKGIERNASNVYEARRRILHLEGSRVVADVPSTYYIPHAPPVFRGATNPSGRLGAQVEQWRSKSPDAESDTLLDEGVWESHYEQVTRNVRAMLRRQAAAPAAPRAITPASCSGVDSGVDSGGSQASLLAVASWLSSSAFPPNQLQRPDSGYGASSSVVSSLAPSPFPDSGRVSRTPSPTASNPASSIPSPGSTRYGPAKAATVAPPSTAPTAASSSAPASAPVPVSTSTTNTAASGSAGASAPALRPTGRLESSGSSGEFPDMERCPDRRAPGYERKTREIAAAAAAAASLSAWDYRRQQALAYKAMQEPLVATQPRVPSSAWSGLGFSRSSPVSSPTPPAAPASTPVFGAAAVAASAGDGDGGGASEARSLWHSSPGPLALRLPPMPVQQASPVWGAAGGHNSSHHHDAPWPPDTTMPLYPPPSDMVEALSALGLHKYIDLFKREEIDLQAFLTLTERDLLEIGITAIGARRKMISAISALKAGNAFFRHKGES